MDPKPFEHIELQSNFENASFSKHQIVVAILQKNELRWTSTKEGCHPTGVPAPWQIIISPNAMMYIFMMSPLTLRVSLSKIVMTILHLFGALEEFLSPVTSIFQTSSVQVIDKKEKPKYHELAFWEVSMSISCDFDLCAQVIFPLWVESEWLTVTKGKPTQAIRNRNWE